MKINSLPTFIKKTITKRQAIKREKANKLLAGLVQGVRFQKEYDAHMMRAMRLGMQDFFKQNKKP